jgi:2-methylcitrate dehydratase
VDATTRKLVEFTTAFSAESLPGSATQAAVEHLVDSVACAIAGYASEPARIAVALARQTQATAPATVFGAGVATSPELAAFANTVMIRTYDWNDGMLAKGGGHPSDMLGALLAVGGAIHASGARVLEAMVLAYELLGALGNSAPVRDRGWDQGTFMGAATALGVGKLLGLSADQLGNAVSLAVVPCVPLRVTRAGALSMWKGCATAAAVRNAVFAAGLAREGMTGPAEPFEGSMGLWDQVTGPFEVSLPADPDGPMVVEISHLKQFPAEAHSQAFLGAVPRIRALAPVEQIESIRIDTYWQAFHEIGSHPAKWDPQTRETADHSLPFLLAAALVDGEISLASFTEARIRDSELRPLMRKISVREEPAFTAAFRPRGGQGITGVPRGRITVRTRSGDELVEEVGYPRGHVQNPMTRADIDAKLQLVGEPLLGAEHTAAIRDAWWNVEQAPDIGRPIKRLVWRPHTA